MLKREKKRPISFKLFSTVIITMLILNILSIIGTLTLSVNSRKQVIDEYRFALRLFMNQLDREMADCQSRMYNSSRSYVYSVAMNDDSDGNQYEIYRSQVELNNTMNEWLNQYQMIDGYFIYKASTGTLIACGNDSAALFQLESRVEEIEPNGRWVIDSSNGSRLIFCAEYHDSVYGAWIQCDRMIERWGIDEENRGYYSFVLKGSEEANDCIDVDSDAADFTLRYYMQPSKSLVPTGVAVLLILSIGMLLALPFVWLRMKRLVINPLRKLENAIITIEGGNASFRIDEESTSSEFNRLNHQFNNSMDQIANMQAQIYEAKLEQERIYVNYLSQQMQPHFVLNTLNLIFSMEPEEYDLIQETVACLSDYYRYIAHIHEPMVPAEAELAHVENYFKLQQIRYPEMFFYNIECSEKLKKAMIPPIIIQTFAENAIKHSLIVGQINRVDIIITEIEEGKLHIMIRDYGKGYPDEVLKKINRFRETGEQQEGLGIGIQNTIERIKLIYQADAGITLRNAVDGGAQIDLYIPYTIFTGDDENEK